MGSKGLLRGTLSHLLKKKDLMRERSARASSAYRKEISLKWEGKLLLKKRGKTGTNKGRKTTILQRTQRLDLIASKRREGRGLKP